MPRGVCVFNPSWVQIENYSEWLKPDVTSRQQAICFLCQKTIQIGSMGEAALKVHSQTATHQRNINQVKGTVDINTYLSPRTTPAVSDSEVSKSVPVPSPLALQNQGKTSVVNSPRTASKSLRERFGGDSELKAETLWTLKTVQSHFAFNSCDDISWCFRTMFPDSAIADKFSMGSTKVGYMATFGLGPYFSDMLKAKARDTDGFVLLFDESLNDELQKKQKKYKDKKIIGCLI